MRSIDYPPVWLLGALVPAWLGRTEASSLEIWLGALTLAIAAAITAAAVFAFARARTTIIPHRAPDALITGGIFALSRNPIYLADLLVLAGLSLAWSSWVGIALVLPLALVLRQRFILKEEARLREAFAEAFAAYESRVRRWL